jgi:hypothetical protein
MKAYLVSYDLDKPGQDYQRLISEIERLGGVKILYSEWVIKSNLTAAQLRDHLYAFMDGNDMLLVVAMTGEIAWNRLMISGQSFKQVVAA